MSPYDRMAWDFSTEPEFQCRLDWMAEFVREHVWPLETVVGELGQDGFERAVAPLRDAVREQGLWAAHLPPELGGQGFGQLNLGLQHEILGSSPYAPIVFGNAAPDSGSSELLALAGTPEQKERWLEPLLAGELRSAFSMTEPGSAGSDPTLLETSAVADGDGWVIDGHKWFSSNGSVADFLIVMAVTDPDAPPHRRASMFVVPADAPGVRIVRDVPTMEHPYEHFGRVGGHAPRSSTTRCACRPAPCSAPAAPASSSHSSGSGPAGSTTACAGSASRGARSACSASAPVSRTAHGSLLADKQTVQNWIADSAAQMQAARLMTLHAAWRIDREGAAAARNEIAMIKFFGAGVLHDVVDRALQAHGALGYSTDCRSRRCTASRVPRGSATGPTRSTASPWRGGSCAPTRRPRAASRASTCRRAARRRASASPACSRR
jgi:acyl-CoA dehydrogenase